MNGVRDAPENKEVEEGKRLEVGKREGKKEGGKKRGINRRWDRGNARAGNGLRVTGVRD